jgi:hypothetical protein
VTHDVFSPKAICPAILWANMAITREEILSEIRKFVGDHDGEVPGERAFARATRIKESAWKGKHWVRWTDAVREAGYDPNVMNQKIPDEDILQKLAVFISSLGHFPVRDEINLHARATPSFPLWQTIQKRYGGMPETAQALLAFSRATGKGDLAKLCEARIQRETAKPIPKGFPGPSSAVKAGFVYLKYSPSLRLYKIGKANSPDKRGAGISLLLPDDLVPKHEIKTDYPYILETYWKKRFSTKKKQGEWYDLNSEDIEAFRKRREFMFSEFFP